MRAVIIGFSHMHVNEIAQYINDCEGFDLVGIAEVPSTVETIPALRYTPVWNFENVRDNFCKNTYDDYRVMLDELKPDFAFILTENCQKPEVVEECAKRGVNVCIEVTGLGIGLIQALDCMKRMGRVALLGCTRSSKFEIDYYGKVHGRGISLIGAHTMARPKLESSAGLWTDVDDIKTLLNLTLGGRLNIKDMILEVHSPADSQAVYDRLVNDKNFPIGVLFDWSKI